MTSRRRLTGLARRSRGQSLVEFAMVLPLLLTVGFIITEFGRALWLKNVLTQACREGCREAVVAGPGNAVQAAEDATRRFLMEQRMLSAPNSPVTNEARVTVKVVPDRNDPNFDLIEVYVERTFFLIPGDTPTEPFGDAELEDNYSTSLTSGEIQIAGRAVMMLPSQ